MRSWSRGAPNDWAWWLCLKLALVGSLLSPGSLPAQPAEPAQPASKDKADHWAFKPLTHPAPPAVRATSWPRNDIDRFILARLEKEGLRPSAEADRRTLIRRVFFDVTGLPPGAEDVHAFLADPDPAAYEHWVDRLLDSPQYGERWARHWLDVVHFGESHGYDKDKPRTHAWPYRDYVIRAFNTDKPYPRFVEEQIAGDVLFPGDADGVVALGFIAAGPWDFVGHVELPESKTDGLIARYNDRDDMVMTTLSTFQSLTVHCARCHDHKFDPIPQKDYYALQAVFAGVDRADRPFDRDPATHRQRQRLLHDRTVLTTRKQPIDDRLARADDPKTRAFDQAIEARKTDLAAAAEPGGASPSNGYHSAIEDKPDVSKWVQVDLAQTRDLAEIRLLPARPTDFADTPGFGFPRRFRVMIADDSGFTAPRIVADHTGSDFANPGEEPVVIATTNACARYVRIEATRLWERTRDFVFALAEMQVISAQTNLARSAEVQALDSIEAGRWGKSRLVDGFDSRKRLAGDPEPPGAAERRERLKSEIADLRRQRLEQAAAGLEPAQREDLGQITRQLADVERQLASLPEPEWVYAATPDFTAQGSFRPPHPPRPVHLLRRGDVKAKAELMAPGALSCFPWLPGDLKVPEPDDEGERRAALARWLTQPGNALLRRSIVNRVWHYHFGRGIVDTPNDFGRMGSLPTHPELLDWLALWFQREGESLRGLHRLILTSATYRQASGPDAQAERLDADNRLLWRMNRSRLDAESLRDALLAVSGRLDPTMGGPSVRQFWFKDDHSPTYDYTRFDVDSDAGRRRSVYRFIVRSVSDPFMDAMDCPDASILAAKRNQTLTALQALALLNNPFVLSQAEHFAARLEAEKATTPERIRRAYEIALSREPTAEELSHVAAYAGRHGLANACRVLLNSSEFCFLD